jgi:uncharacterized protein YndB with AHSA1/START domain
MKGSATATINKPIEEVFSFISNVENQDLWVKGSSETKLVSEESIELGSTFEGKFTYSGKIHEIKYEVVNYTPPNLFGVKSTQGPFPFESWLNLKNKNDQTEIVNTMEAGSDHIITTIMFILLKPILRRQMNKQMRQELNELKLILESNSEA